MRIVIIQPYAPDEQRSMLRFGAGLEQGLRKAGVTVSSVAPAVVFGRLGRCGSAMRKWAGYVDKYVLFRPKLRRARRAADVVHVIDQGSAMYVNVLDPARTLVTVHDLFAVETMLGRIPNRRLGHSGQAQQRWILSGLRRARHFTAVSEATAKAMCDVLGPGTAVAVIPNALDPTYRPADAQAVAAVRAAAGVPAGAGYFVHVGGNSFYKNRPGVVALFDALVRAGDASGDWLVLAGRPPDDELLSAITAAGAGAQIAILPEPSDAQLVALYTGARALLFPSRMEGFGWPIIEAQACGCPVVTTDRDPMRSVAGNAAILVPPDDPAAGAADVAAGLRDDAALRAAGTVNAAAYASDAIYAHYRDVYRAVIAASNS
jgi:glycosyltransferase involved in cell wall biosynthesis